MRIFALLLPIILFACQGNPSKSSVAQASEIIESSITHKDISVSEAKDMIALMPGLVILDVRTPGEFKDGNITSAINIDYKDDNFNQEIVKLDKDVQYLVYCRSGRRSKASAEIMTGLGFKNVSNMDGGYLAWSDAE